MVSQGGNNGTTASNTVSVTFPSGFNLATIGCGDINLSINGTATSLNDASGSTQTACLNTGTSWGVLIDPTNRVLTLTTPTSAALWVAIATGTPITISIGSNATFQTQRCALDHESVHGGSLYDFCRWDLRRVGEYAGRHPIGGDGAGDHCRELEFERLLD